MAENHEPVLTQDDDQEIDLLELASKLWEKRRRLLYWGFIGAVVGLVIAFSIPPEYSASAKLAPEVDEGGGRTGGLSVLASMAGIGAGTPGSDAVYPMLYPDIVSSVPFITGLFDVEVETEEGQKMPLKQYMTDDISSPWWSKIFALPRKLIAALSPSDAVDEGHMIDNFRLTKQEAQLVALISARVSAAVDSKTSLVEIDVKMQDPLVAAMLTDTVVSRLQSYITDYRTNKARKDLEYAEEINAEARQEYYRAQQKLADYSDRNQGLATQSARIARDRLENEAQLAFTLYNQTAQHVQRAKAVVQEHTPVYVVVVPATVPNFPESPRKAMITIGCAFVAVVGYALWLLFLQPLIQSRKEEKKPEE